MINKLKCLLPLALSVFTLSQIPVYAEDIEIYLGGSDSIDAGMPVVMLSIDLRANTGSTACGTGVEPPDSCKFLVAGYTDDDKVGCTPGNSVDHLFNDYETDDNGDIVYEAEDDGTPIYETEDDGTNKLDDNGDPIPIPKPSLLSTEEKLKDNTKGKLVCTNPENLYDLLKAALHYVLYDLKGIKAGIMVNHKNIASSKDNDSKGGKQNDCVHRDDLDGCSNGGFILKHATALTDTDRFKSAYDALSRIRGVENHPYQGTELFFELYRYLSGQAIWNAHVDNVDDEAMPPESWDKAAEGTKGVGTAVSGDLYEGAFVPENVYISPIEHQCSKIYTINFIHGVSNDDAQSNYQIVKPIGTGDDVGYNKGLNVDLDDIPNAPSWTDVGIAGFGGGKIGEFERVLLLLNDIDLADGNHGVIGDTFEDENWKMNVTSHFFEQGNVETLRIKKMAAAGGGSAYNIGADPQDLIKDLGDIFNNILSISSTFVSASIPVNVFDRSQFLSNVYLAVFEAEESGKPRWIGNLKRLALNETLMGKDADGNDIVVEEANSRVIDASPGGTTDAFLIDGRLKPTALTFWTDILGSDIATYRLKDDDDFEGNNISDGHYIDRGGAGQQIPGYLIGTTNDRNIYTDGANDALLSDNPIEVDSKLAGSSVDKYWDFINDKGWAKYDSDPDPDNVIEVVADFDHASDDDKTMALNILKYARGDGIAADGTSFKRWMFGDPIHSKPVPINYGSTAGYTEANPNIRIVMGANDGIFRMIENNANATNNGDESGKELWGFIPQEMLSIQYDLMDNKVLTSSSDSPPTSSYSVHPYGIDGAPVVYAYDKNNDGTLDHSVGDKVHTFFGLRRGGKSVYALDISNPDTPKFMWKKSQTPPDDISFKELGYTFSNPRVTNIQIDSNPSESTVKPEDFLSLVFAGGYDIKKDEKNVDAVVSDTEGRAIYVVDIENNGEVIWKAAYGATTGYVKSDNTFYHNGMLHSIPSDVTVLDTTGNNRADRMYVGDTGGNIWRIDMYGLDRKNWGMYKFASLGDTGKSNDRRFFHRPDFVRSSDASGVFDAVIIGSGDRANPKDRFSGTYDSIPQNYLYMLKDKHTRPISYSECTEDGDGSCNIPATIVLSELSDLTDNCIQDYDVTCDSDNNNLVVITDPVDSDDETRSYSKNGWYIRLTDFAISEGADVYQGEKSLSSPLTLAGVIFFTTYLPKVEYTGDEPEQSSCGPSAGSGLVYAVDIHNAGARINLNTSKSTTGNKIVTHTKEDRIERLGTGIPAGVVPLGQGRVLAPGGIVLQVDSEGTWKTFWHEIN